MRQTVSSQARPALPRHEQRRKTRSRYRTYTSKRSVAVSIRSSRAPRVNVLRPQPQLSTTSRTRASPEEAHDTSPHELRSYNNLRLIATKAIVRSVGNDARATHLWTRSKFGANAITRARSLEPSTTLRDISDARTSVAYRQLRVCREYHIVVRSRSTALAGLVAHELRTSASKANGAPTRISIAPYLESALVCVFPARGRRFPPTVFRGLLLRVRRSTVEEGAPIFACSVFHRCRGVSRLDDNESTARELEALLGSVRAVWTPVISRSSSLHMGVVGRQLRGILGLTRARWSNASIARCFWHRSHIDPVELEVPDLL